MLRSNERFDTSIEEFLDEFKLREPRALPRSVSSIPAWRRFAAAACVLVSFGISMRLLLRNSGAPYAPSAVSSTSASDPERYQRPSSITLTHLAFSDPARFDAELVEASRKSLPNFQRVDSALQGLTKE